MYHTGTGDTPGKPVSCGNSYNTGAYVSEATISFALP